MTCRRAVLRAGAGRPGRTCAAGRRARGRRGSRRRRRAPSRCPGGRSIVTRPVAPAGIIGLDARGAGRGAAELVGLERHRLRAAGLVGDHQHDLAGADGARGDRGRRRPGRRAVSVTGGGGPQDGSCAARAPPQPATQAPAHQQTQTAHERERYRAAHDASAVAPSDPGRMLWGPCSSCPSPPRSSSPSTPRPTGSGASAAS